MNSLIALDLAGGQRFVDELSRAWDNGDAILPIDQRLAIPAKRALMTQMRASQVIDETGSTSLEGGQETGSMTLSSLPRVEQQVKQRVSC